MKKRLLSLVLAAVMCISIAIPASAAQAAAPFSVAPPASGWEIFDGNYGQPASQVDLLYQMIKTPRFGGYWNDVIIATLMEGYDYAITKDYRYYPNLDYSSIQYTEKGVEDALRQIFGGGDGSSSNGYMEEFDGQYPKMLKAMNLDAETLANTKNSPVFYTFAYCMPDDFVRNPVKIEDQPNVAGVYSVDYTAQVFYDFEIHGIADDFNTPKFSKNDSMDQLKDSGINFSLTGSADGKTLNVENPTSKEIVASQAYSYEKTTTASTSVESAYSENWSNETMLGTEVTISVPMFDSFSSTAKVENTFSFGYEMANTYASTKGTEETETINSSVSMPLPPHTKASISVDVADTQTKIPYDGRVWISYKTILQRGLTSYTRRSDGTCMVLNMPYDFSTPVPANEGDLTPSVYHFGRNGLSATEDLQDRIANRKVAGYNADYPHMQEWVDGYSLQGAAHALHNNAPIAPYFGDFYFNTTSVNITPQPIVPMYALRKVVPSTDSLTVKAGAQQPLGGITAEAFDLYDVPYYGFNVRTDGAWQLTMDEGDPGDYAEISYDKNQKPVLNGLKPTNGAKLYLEYQPRDMSKCTNDYYSEPIAVVVESGRPQANFKDVHTYDFFYEPVYWAVEKGITDGTSPTTFSPKDDCTREQVATFLWRYEGKPAPRGNNPFQDVYAGHYAYAPIVWAAENGIANGLTATTFGPKDEVTRAQFVTMLWRLAGEPQPESMKSPFKDVNANSWYGKAVLWAVENGITQGATTNTFNPNGICERGQVVTFLYRYDSIN